MSVGKVSFGNYPQVDVQPKEKASTGVIKGTAVAAGIGASITGAVNLGFMAKKDTIINFIRKKAVNNNKAIKAIFGDTAQTKAIIAENCQKTFAKIKEIRAFNYKHIAKNAGRAALIWGTVYLGYRGLKALFTSKS